MLNNIKHKKYVLVVGGAGYIGSIVTSILIKKNINVIIIDNLSTGSKFLLNKKAKFFKLDICNFKKMERKLKDYNISSILHFAACLSVNESEQNPLKYYKNNVLGTENVLKIAQKKKIKKFIFSSTCAVYGNSKKIILSENEPTLPISNYGKTKLLAENLIINHSIKFNYKYAILRYFNVVGSNMAMKLGQINGKTLFKELSKKIINKKYTINIFGKNYFTRDGTCIRDYIDVNDLSYLHLMSLEKLENKKSKSFIINCGYNKGFSVYQVVNYFSKIIKKKIKIIYKPKREGDVEAVYCNSKKLKKIFPTWKQKYKIFDSIKSMLGWEMYLKKNKKL